MMNVLYVGAGLVPALGDHEGRPYGITNTLPMWCWAEYLTNLDINELDSLTKYRVFIIMKILLFIAAFIPLFANAGEETQWHWRYGSSAWDGWFETYGMGDLNIRDGKINGSLFDHEDTKFERIRLKGSMHQNKAKISVTIIATDIGIIEMTGEYKSREFNGSLVETIIFTDKFDYIALTRTVQKEAPNKNANNSLSIPDTQK